MPGKTAEKLQAVLDAGDTDACVRFFADASERERQALAKLADGWMRKIAKDAFQQTAPGRFEPNPLLSAAGAAVLGACPLSTVMKYGWRVSLTDDRYFRVLADRRPKWLDDYAESLLDDDHPAWLWVRKLMKAGLCRKPKHVNYVLGMLNHHAGVGGSGSNPTERRGYTSSTWCILSHLDAEPDLLEDLWRLFEIEGGGEYSLATHDKYAHDGNRWDLAFVELSRRSTFPRKRLLDSSLDALERGFAQFRAGWFSAFHELLKPTIEERAARSDRYLQLLASPIPPTVSFALAALDTIDAERPLGAGPLIDGLRPLMVARVKGTVKGALKLLDRVARREPRGATEIARVAAEALACESSDVQAAGLKFIETHGAHTDDELVEAVRRAQGLVAASLRGRINEWLKVETGDDDKKKQSKRPAGSNAHPTKDALAISNTEIKALKKRASQLPAEWRALAGVDRALAALQAGTLDFSAGEFDGTEFPRLRADWAIEPLATLDDLIDAALTAIENPDDYDRIEWVYDGVSRLCDQRPPDFERRTGPLLKRATQLLSRQWLIPFVSDEPCADLLGVLLWWLVGECGTYARTRVNNRPAIELKLGEVSRTTYMADETGLGLGLRQRAREIAERAAKCQSVPLLSAPSHRGGWIDPLVLARRVQKRNGAADAGDFEHVLSLLRLAPENRNDALPLLAGLKGEYASGLRYALGDSSVRAGTTPWLWAAAARGRSAWKDDARIAKQHPDLGPDATMAAQPAWRVAIQNGWPRLKVDVSPKVTSKPDQRLLSVSLWHRPKSLWFHIAATSVAAIRELQALWPLGQESCFAIAAGELAGNLDWWEARWWNRTWLEPLLDPDVPLRPMALLVLVLELAAKEPGEQGFATDIAVAAINDGRLDGIKLGSLMAELLPTGLIKAARWAKSLADVARSSPLHAEVVRVAVSRSLRGNIKKLPKDLHALVDLLKELVAETETPVDADARNFLTRISGSTKLAKATKAILACDGSPDPARHVEIQRTVVEQRIARVERWVG